MKSNGEGEHNAQSTDLARFMRGGSPIDELVAKSSELFDAVSSLQCIEYRHDNLVDRHLIDLLRR